MHYVIFVSIQTPKGYVTVSWSGTFTSWSLVITLGTDSMNSWGSEKGINLPV